MGNQGNRLIKSMKEALAFLDGDKTQGRLTRKKRIEKVEIPDDIDVRSIREHLHMSQAEFAARFAFNLGTLRNWEYGRRHPDFAAKTYLYLIAKHPDLVEKSLRD